MGFFTLNKKLKWNADTLDVESSVSVDFQKALRECTKQFEDTVTSMVVDHFRCDFSDFREYLRNKAEWRRKQEQAMPKWIPVKDQPPAAEGEITDVLTIDAGGEQRVLYFDGGNWCWPTGEPLRTARMFPVTHWMPLPEEPKGESDGERD